MQIEEAGRYYVDVSSFTEGQYTIDASLQADDFGNSAAAAGAIAIGENLTVERSFFGDQDWVAIELTDGDLLYLDIDDEDAHLELLYDGRVVASSSVFNTIVRPYYTQNAGSDQN